MNQKFELGNKVKIHLPNGDSPSLWHNRQEEITEIVFKNNHYLYGLSNIPYVIFYEYELLPLIKNKSHPLTNIFK